jgi:predicted Zn-dependent protease
MHDLTPGHLHLEAGRYQKADEYFSKMAVFFKNDPRTVNGCLYGQARAMMGLGNLVAATTLLKCVIQNKPTWEAPYITLGRVYELQGSHFRTQGMSNLAEGMFAKAQETYENAIKNTTGSERLSKHYAYCKNESEKQFGHLQKTNSFTPGYASIRKGSTENTYASNAPQDTVLFKPTPR